MQTRIAVAIVLAALIGSSGCVSLTIGGGKSPPTVAQEIRELRRLKRWGTISNEDFETGKLTLLRGGGSQDAVSPPSETRVAAHSEPEIKQPEIK